MICIWYMHMVHEMHMVYEMYSCVGKLVARLKFWDG